MKEPAVGVAELRASGIFAHRDWLLFDESLVGNCGRRAAFSRFAGAVIAGRDPLRRDSAIVRQNATTFIEALRRVWPTADRRIPGGHGAFRDDMSALLVRDELPVAAVRPLLLKIIADDGLTGEVAYVLLTRRDRGIVPTLRDSIDSSDVKQRIYEVAIRQRIGDNVEASIQELRGRNDLSPTARAVIGNV